MYMYIGPVNSQRAACKMALTGIGSLGSSCFVQILPLFLSYLLMVHDWTSVDDIKYASQVKVLLCFYFVESCASRGFDRSIEILPGGRESSRISLARASSLPGPELHSVDWPPHFHPRTRSSSKIKSTASDDESSDSVAVSISGNYLHTRLVYWFRFCIISVLCLNTNICQYTGLSPDRGI